MSSSRVLCTFTHLFPSIMLYKPQKHFSMVCANPMTGPNQNNGLDPNASTATSMLAQTIAASHQQMRQGFAIRSLCMFSLSRSVFRLQPAALHEIYKKDLHTWIGLRTSLARSWSEENCKIEIDHCNVVFV